MDMNIALELANSLETVSINNLQNTPIARKLAELIMRYGETNLMWVDSLAQTMFLHTIQKPQDYHMEITPDILLRTETLREGLYPWVEKIRQKLFHQTEAPFRNYEEAVKWIRQYDIPSSPPDEQGISHSLEGFRRNVRIDYEEGTENDNIIFARINSPLEKIIYSCQKLTTKLEIGLDWNSLVFFVLADIRPFVSPIGIGATERYVELPSGKLMRYREVDIKIREDFNRSYFAWMYEEVRRMLKLTRKKPFTDKHVELYLLVSKKGGTPPKKGAVAFWTDIMNQWNCTHAKKHKYSTWKGLEIAYRRLNSRLELNESGNLEN